MISRRRFLQVTGAAIAGSTLAACGDGGTAGGGAKASGELKLPTYKPFEGLHPDLPGAESGLERLPEVPGGRDRQREGAAAEEPGDRADRDVRDASAADGQQRDVAVAEPGTRRRAPADDRHGPGLSGEVRDPAGQ